MLKNDWNKISEVKNLSEEFIHQNASNLNWELLIKNSKMNEDFIEKHEKYLNNYCWFLISSNIKLSNDFMNKHFNKLSFKNIIFKFGLNEDFINKHSNELPWIEIVAYQKISEKLMENNIKHLNHLWKYVSKHQTLSESFIEKYKNKVDWDNIYKYQKLSEAFIRKHIDKVCFETILSSKIPQQLKNEIVNKRNKEMEEMRKQIKSKLRVI